MAELSDLPRFRRGAEWALAVGVALELGLFEALAPGSADSEALARGLQLDPRGVATLLGALEPVGAVVRDGRAWRLTGPARARFVDRDTPDYDADRLRHWMRSMRRWTSELGPTIREGVSPDTGKKPDGVARRGEDLERFMAAMANRPAEWVAAIADAVRMAAPSARTLLDAGGGPGILSRALVERGFRVTLMDRPEVIEFVADRYGLAEAEGIRLLSGDFHSELPTGGFDVALFSNVSHIFGAEKNRELVDRAARALSPGGTLAIVDFVRGESEFAALFALTMLMVTEEGGTWDRADYESWLRAAGLERFRCVTVMPDVQLVTGHRTTGRASHER
jgi:SAM-dependent methyltransferase